MTHCGMNAKVQRTNSLFRHFMLVFLKKNLTNVYIISVNIFLNNGFDLLFDLLFPFIRFVVISK